MRDKTWWKSPIIIGGGMAIIGGFMGGVGSEAFLLIKVIFTETTLDSPFSLEQILRYVAVGVGFLALIVGIYKNKKSNHEHTAESKLNELIKELQSFNKRWNKGKAFLTLGYRKQILSRTMLNQNPEKIRNNSVKIKRKNAQLKELKIKNASDTTDTITHISDDIAKLGIEVENTFLTLRQEKEAVENNPKIFENFVKKGDQICQEIQKAIIDLEKIRTHVYETKKIKK